MAVLIFLPSSVSSKLDRQSHQLLWQAVAKKSAIFVFADLTPDGFHFWMTLSPRTSEPVRPCPLEQNSGDATGLNSRKLETGSRVETRQSCLVLSPVVFTPPTRTRQDSFVLSVSAVMWTSYNKTYRLPSQMRRQIRCGSNHAFVSGAINIIAMINLIV